MRRSSVPPLLNSVYAYEVPHASAVVKLIVTFAAAVVLVRFMANPTMQREAESCKSEVSIGSTPTLSIEVNPLADSWKVYKEQLARRRKDWPGWEPTPGKLYAGFPVKKNWNPVKTNTCQASIALRYLLPIYPCPQQRRVGTWADGGKWICAVDSAFKNKPPTVYSVGSNGDPSFEDNVWTRFGAKSYTFDPTLETNKTRTVLERSYIELHNLGLSGAANLTQAAEGFQFLAEGARLMYIEDVMAMLGHAYVDVLKIDCETCEHDVVARLERTTTRDRPLFGQVLMEVHMIDYDKKADLLFGRMEALGYLVFATELNHYDPSCVEVAYIHDSLVRADGPAALPLGPALVSAA